MKAREFDKKIDEGGDISQQLDISKARRPKQEQKRVNEDFPEDRSRWGSSTGGERK